MQYRFTKIVATLGPATSNKEMIELLTRAGVNVFRLNFSHGDYATHEKNFKAIRALSKRTKTSYGILCDLQGPKLRVGQFIGGKVVLQPGQNFKLDMDPTLGDANRVSLMHPEIFKVLKKDMMLLLNDGNIQLRVANFTKNSAETVVVVGGELSDHKGVNLPDVELPISSLTDKDKKDLKFALSLGADWICLSFVQKPQDVIDARELIGNKAGIIVKIEKPSALNYLKEIVDLADGVMVARGDLGVECPIESVPSIQRNIIETCRMAGKPVIVATQMLESMIKAPVPTRAEVSDIATAVYEGADAVMLSGETAMGDYPINAVSIMKRVILMTEQDSYYKRAMSITTLPPDQTIASAITASVHQIAQVLKKPACVVCYSVTGKTTLRTARERTLVPILGLTIDEKIANKLALVWGVQSHVTKQLQDMVEVTPIALSMAEKLKLAESGDEIIITAGIPFAKKGNTNILHIAMVK